MDATSQTASDELELVERLRAGDEDAFMFLVDRLQPMMVRVARMYVSSQAVAEEIVQEAWLGVLKGIGRFEGRSSLRTWILRIVSNIAKTRGQREGRSVPFASLAGDDLDAPTFDPDRFLGPGEEWAGHWSTVPADWRGMPEERLAATETLSVVQSTIDTLPPMQAEVIRLRDVLGWTSAEVRNALDLSETNQRVLLHRARAKVRAALELEFTVEAET
ncbi:MAG: sigma-70 family RNA polymerase sigma factor [Actinomycetota bacterium]|nr:sigma-70 family RNA polymerase sigma factor [Actinomycetota bacterium]MDH5313205.1 sigma-70 family RNA polymerase sigma factor [Actinomycetota bacterium]